MARNVEIKARVRDWRALERRAAAIADRPPIELVQRDTFYCANNGRLKLRVTGEGLGELIAYVRPDTTGPTGCEYTVHRTSDPDGLDAALSATIGVRGTVAKTRLLLLVGATRIHLDRVEGLGEFVELEVVLGEQQSAHDGDATARELMEKLQIDACDLIECAYIDLIEQRNGAPSGGGRARRS